MANQHERNEKIIRMKLQTAKILWHENRKDASYLVLESVSDHRADELRNQMGFNESYEVEQVRQQSRP